MEKRSRDQGRQGREKGCEEGRKKVQRVAAAFFVSQNRMMYLCLEPQFPTHTDSVEVYDLSSGL